MSNNPKKILAGEIKQKLNSPEYIAMPDLISMSEFCLDILVWYPDKKSGWIDIINPNLTADDFHRRVKRKELEENDWEEIVNLIEKKNQEKRKIYEEKKKNIVTKLNSQANLYYHWGPRANHKGDIGSMSEKGMRSYLQLKGGKDYLFIAENHPVLNNFSWQVGFFVVEAKGTVEPSSGSRPNKFIEVSDQITITPHQTRSVEDKSVNRKIVGACNKCGMDYKNSEIWYYSTKDKETPTKNLEWFCGECWKEEEKNYRQTSSQKNTVYKVEHQKDNLGDEHYYYFENGRWISLESGTPDPNTTNSDGKLSRLVTLVDHTQPPTKGKDKNNWDYFYYVFATENGEKFEVSALNPAIGFEARNKKEELFPRAGNNGVQFWYKLSWKETEKDKRKFEKEDFIEIEKWSGNANDKPNRQSLAKIWENEWESEKNKTHKEMSISIISEFFREWNVKAIEITSSGDLFIEYNQGNSETIKNDERGSGIIKNNLEKVLGKRKLNQQELESFKTSFHSDKNSSRTNSPKSEYIPYLIGGGVIVIVLGGLLISYRLIRKKRKK